MRFETVIWPGFCHKTVHKSLELAPNWRVQSDDLLADSTTGEVLPNTPANVIALLLGRPAPDAFPHFLDTHKRGEVRNCPSASEALRLFAQQVGATCIPELEAIP